MSEQKTPGKKISVGLILSWIFGVLFALIGIISVFSEPIPGLVMLIMAAALLPPVTKLVDQKWKFHLSSGMKIVVIIIGFLIFGMTIDTSNVSTTQKNEPQKEGQQASQNEDVINETPTTKQVEEEQLQTKTNEQNPKEKKTEIISTSYEEENDEIPEETDSTTSTDTDQEPTPTQTIDEPETKSTPETKPTETVSQKNAVRSAKDYLNYSSFSYSGLIEQLEYEQFSHADAVYGVDNSGADWFEQAGKSAEEYMKYSAFSRGSLIEQLKYEGFTQAQAEHGADTVGL